MTDDFTDLPNNAQCYVVNSATSIYVYRNNTRDTYTQIGGKWYQTAESSYISVPSSSVCWSYTDITSLNSRAEYYPIYAFIALVLAVFVWYFVYRLMSRLIKWRV